MNFKEYVTEYTTLVYTDRIDELTAVGTGQISTYEVPLAKSKTRRTFKTDIKPEDRSFKNLPRYADKKSKCRFQDWLCIEGKGGGTGSHGQPTPNYYGKSTNGKWYGWSHRAVFGFQAGHVVKEGDISIDSARKVPYTIKDDADAEWHAIKFAKEVS